MIGHRGRFSAVRTEGGLLPQDLLARLRSGDGTLPGLTGESYHLAPRERIGEAANRAWGRLVTAWRSFEEARGRAVPPATGPTRERWLLPLFQELGFGRLPRAQPIQIDQKTFAISHTWHHSPVHLLGCGVDLDRRQAGVAGAARTSPHGLVQDFLNRSDRHLWGFVSNGLQLRLLRNHRSLTRQAYIEFDLQAIMRGEQFSDFLLLWVLCHQSRVEAERPSECWLERWFTAARDQGVRALDKLRGGVQQAIEAFGSGFLTNAANAPLHAALASGELDTREYYRQLLRLVYRLIFLFVAEERDVLLDPAANDVAANRYLQFYATRRLRLLGDRRRGGSHGDLWHGLRVVMSRLYNGCPELALPALGSALWNPEACAALVSAECSNAHVLDAVRHLSTIREQGIPYPVNWRSIGADELGSIYESLLELHPRLNRDAGTFQLDTAGGHERKTTGSYYTPAPLVDCLLDSALQPVLEEAARQPNPEQAILGLRICDPACGSGHFLVAAARRIATRLAAIRVGEDEPSPREVQHALRDVVGRCLFGVDINPMAVELCKVSLWLEAIEPGRPLSFLDSHIQCGNALIGATPALMARGIPDIAFTAIEGDDKTIATDLRRRNKKERASLASGQRTMHAAFEAPIAKDIAAITERILAIDSERDDDIGALRLKERRWDDLARSGAFSDLWFRADAWCASFVWPKQTGDLADAAITADRWRDISTDTSTTPRATRRIVRELSRCHRFFHWHLAFPTVFATETENAQEDPGEPTGWNDGFDVVLGNPPWDTLSPDVKEFFSRYEPSIRSQDSAGQREIMSRLLEDTPTATAWAKYRRDLYGAVHFMKASGRYTLFAPGNLGKGDFNVYRMFVETSLRTIREGGLIAQVVPDGLYSGANCMAIRRELFERCQLDQILGFENWRKSWFTDIHGSAKFTIYTARRASRTTRFRAAFNIRSVQELTDAQAGNLLLMTPGLVKAFSADALAIMEFSSQRDIDIAEKMYRRHPRFDDERDGQPRRHYMREVDMGNDRSLFDEDPSGAPLYEGRMVAQYDHRAKGYRSGRGRKAVWEELPFSEPTKSIQPQWRIPTHLVPDRALERCQDYRIGFCDVASPTNERSLVAALIPRYTVCGDKVPTISFGDAAPWTYAVWLAVANSFVMDFLVRMKVGLSMTYTILDGMPFPRPASQDAVVRALVPRVLRLTCTGPEMIDFWNMAAEDDWVPQHRERHAVPGTTDEGERRLLRSEIDACVARDVYRLTRDELAHVLDTFPIVKKQDSKRFGEFRTKHLVLNAYEQLPAEVDERSDVTPNYRAIQVPSQSRSRT
ncbi:MAG: N-6 DNA methylase [Acidobacteria bacterium]|nr:N-6 DNA methylase [Acidobacteriota bacterium]